MLVHSTLISTQYNPSDPIQFDQGSRPIPYKIYRRSRFQDLKQFQNSDSKFKTDEILMHSPLRYKNNTNRLCHHGGQARFIPKKHLNHPVVVLNTPEYMDDRHPI